MDATYTLPNLKNYTPFTINIEECGTTHQVDVLGVGVLNYNESITAELYAEIRTNIDNEIVRYFEDLPVDPSTLGYSFTIKPKKKQDRNHNCEIIDLSVSLFVEQVEGGNDTAQLALIKIITLIILQEIMILP